MQMTRRSRHWVMGVALSALVLGFVGCDVAEGDAELETLGRILPANGDTEIHLGPTAVDPECLIWDFGGNTVNSGPEYGDDTLWKLNESGDEIRTADGALACTIETADDGGVILLREGDEGPAIASLWRSHAYFGDISKVPESKRPYLTKDYTFKGPRLVEGDGKEWRRAGGEVVTATKNISNADPERRMAVAALVMGLCGSDGLPDQMGDGAQLD